MWPDETERKKRHNKNIKSQLTHSRSAFQVLRLSEVVGIQKNSRFLRNQHLAGMFYVFCMNWKCEQRDRDDYIISSFFSRFLKWIHFSTFCRARKEFYWLASSRKRVPSSIQQLHFTLWVERASSQYNRMLRGLFPLSSAFKSINSVPNPRLFEWLSKLRLSQWFMWIKFFFAP